MAKQERSSCCGFSWLACALLPVILAGTYYGTEQWLETKSYEFSSREIADVSNAARAGYDGKPGQLETMFANITHTLAQRHPHAIMDVQPEWIFINAGGWMGSFALVYASLSEYVLLFGTAVPTSGHSGRYWAHIEDTLLTGTFTQWSEGTLHSVEYPVGTTIPHGKWEATCVSWGADTWMAEYARGAIATTMPFAFADSAFSTLDYISIGKAVVIYARMVVGNMLRGVF